MPLAVLLGVPTPLVRVAQLSKAEVAALARAAEILHRLRESWGDDSDHVLDTDVALAAYTMDELVEVGGRVEVGYQNVELEVAP